MMSFYINVYEHPASGADARIYNEPYEIYLSVEIMKYNEIFDIPLSVRVQDCLIHYAAYTNCPFKYLNKLISLVHVVAGAPVPRVTTSQVSKSAVLTIIKVLESTPQV